MMAASLFVCMLGIVSSSFGYQYSAADKDSYLTDAFLREMAQHMSRDLVASAPDGYIDPPEPSDRYLGSRVMKALEGDDTRMPVDLEQEGLSPPSLRDREFLQHSSLFSNQLAGKDADTNVLSQSQIKTDPTLPAYCNPPNPCPVGYTAEDGCLEEFENTAAFSRNYQAMQECMCDTEHMFDCPIRDDSSDYDGDGDLGDNPFINEYSHKNLVAKKFHVKKSSNPYLQGEKLPIAAKKGHQLVQPVQEY